MNIANSVADIGIIMSPNARYIPGKIVDIVNIMSENIWHVQHEEKNEKACCISTGDTVRQIDTPTMPIPAARPPMTNGATAPAEIGIAAINQNQNFFNMFMLFIIPQIILNVI